MTENILCKEKTMEQDGRIVICKDCLSYSIHLMEPTWQGYKNQPAAAVTVRTI